MTDKLKHNWANWISVGRCISVPFFIGVLEAHRQADFAGAAAPQLAVYRHIALAVFGVACLSDAVDGYVARRFGLVSELGKFLDPLADKLLLTAGVVMLSLPIGIGACRFPYWFPIVVISRDVLIMLGTILIFMLRQRVLIQPSKIGKATTFFQMACVAGALMLWRPLWLLLATVALTAVSCFQYVYQGMHQLGELAHGEGGK